MQIVVCEFPSRPEYSELMRSKFRRLNAFRRDKANQIGKIRSWPMWKPQGKVPRNAFAFGEMKSRDITRIQSFSSPTTCRIRLRVEAVER